MNLILDENEGWRTPFSEEDLKNIFYLERITPFLTKKSAKEIIELLPSTTLDECKVENFNKENYDVVVNGEDDFDADELGDEFADDELDAELDGDDEFDGDDDDDDEDYDTNSASSTQEDYDERNRYEKIYLNQVREATIAAL